MRCAMKMEKRWKIENSNLNNFAHAKTFVTMNVEIPKVKLGI